MSTDLFNVLTDFSQKAAKLSKVSKDQVNVSSDRFLT